MSANSTDSDNKPTVGAAKPGVSTVAVHAGEKRQKFGDAITDPIFCSATYTFTDSQSVINFIEQKQPREEYGRYGNPSEKALSSVQLAELRRCRGGRVVHDRHVGLWSAC